VIAVRQANIGPQTSNGCLPVSGKTATVTASHQRRLPPP
jgi:hypothetical protein